MVEAADVGPGASDAEVAAWAVRQARVLVTEDRDFGRLVYAFGQRTLGVICVRWPHSARGALRRVLTGLLAMRGEPLQDAFNVVSPRGIRLRRPPRG